MNGMLYGLYQGTAFSRAESFDASLGFNPCSQRLKPLSRVLRRHDSKSCPDTNLNLDHLWDPPVPSFSLFLFLLALLAWQHRANPGIDPLLLIQPVDRHHRNRRAYPLRVGGDFDLDKLSRRRKSPRRYCSPSRPSTVE